MIHVIKIVYEPANVTHVLFKSYNIEYNDKRTI